jgi:cell division protein FtsW (lipid II flippase)
MARKLKSDRVLFLTTILLVGLSMIMVYSASAIQAERLFNEPYRFVTRGGFWALR